ncbi:response regulator transcription factor [Paenibacillus soyae]|uniref:Response regulator n=1 Tax=Paenibacillus soyae TaxID=2969249 RepID=A0A9X2MT78_9BACL|nr:response regulator [Paenibacillus soyae]MCR2806025.1 response regulator [Paenibacillus soyae]
MYKVMLVDDEPHAIEGLRMFVDWEQLGFQICGVCESGSEALAAARESMPHVIVTDIRMPEMDGLELIRKLQEEGGKGAPAEIVLVSAYSDFSFAKRAMQLGVYHYLLKPIIGEEAAEVLTQIRARLDARQEAMQKGQGGGEAASLPALAARLLKDVLQAIEDADGDRAASVIDRLFRELEGHSFEWAELFAGSLTVQCGKLIRESGGDPALLLRPRQASDRYETSADAASVRARILSFVEQVIGAVQTIRESKPGSTLMEIDRYVRNDYRSPLTIRDIAARFYLNPVYLGRAYQSKFGRGLLDRIHDLRIAEACEKLRGTTEPISVIAEQVGYAHYRHFLQHFERRTGKKPAEFRTAKTDFSGGYPFNT